MRVGSGGGKNEVRVGSEEEVGGKDMQREMETEYKNIDHMKEGSLHELEEKSKALASCTYEENTLWGKKVTFFLIVPLLAHYCEK